MDYGTNQVFLKNLEDTKQPPKQFAFDGVYNVDSITETIYNDVGFPLVESVSQKLSKKTKRKSANMQKPA
jgi:hypothetical protein